MEISDDVAEFVEKQKLGFVATVNPDNSPNLSPKGTIYRWNGCLVFANIRSPNTIANLEKNPLVELNVVDPFLRKGIRCKGTARIIKDGKEFENIMEFYKKRGVKSTINSFVIIEAEQVKEVTSPLYDLGLSEDNMRKKWKKYYLNL